MFKDSEIFTSFSVDNIESVKDFYANILGLDIEENSQMGMPLLKLKFSNGGWVMVYPKGEGHMPAEYTVLNIQVEDIEKSVNELKLKGVNFEHYDSEYIKMNENNISLDDKGQPYIAWFKDPAGNILAIVQER